MKRYKIIILLVPIYLIALSVKSQSSCDTLPFLNCQLNTIVPANNDSNLINLINKLHNKDSIQIIHIGDSHLQAGFLTEKIKQNLFQYYSNDTIAAPGFIFPYTIAETNNPFFFKVNYTGNWNWCKNIDQEKTCGLGLSGITVQTKDTIASVSIKMRNNKYNYPVKYYFDKIKILHNSINSAIVSINGIKANYLKEYSIVDLQYITDSIYIEIKQPKESNFELYGIILKNSETKINYHSIGVNGATAQSYLKCDYLSNHIKLINPDLVIISLGTNEAFNEDFLQLEHEFILKDLIFQIKDILPNTAIILTTINDHVKDGENVNPNIISVNSNIIKIANKLNFYYWDFYSIMGGENSINDWYSAGLTGEDKVHFKRLGYEMQGELFTKALIQLIENYKE